MQAALSNASRLVAGACWTEITALSSSADWRAVQVDGSGTRSGNGVFVIPLTSMSSMFQPVPATLVSVPIRNRSSTD